MPKFWLSTFLPAAFLLLSFQAHSQTASVKDIPADGEATTISIQKGIPKSNASREVLEGSAEIAGDTEVLEKAAKKSWTKACDDWKKEVKEMNKDNEVMVLNCNAAKCEKETNIQIVCKSVATYKIRLKLQQ